MNYEYTDHYKVTLDVSPSVPNANCVTIRATRDFNDSAPRAFIPVKEAPALALAILEAAGLPETDTDVCLAAASLIDYKRKRAEQAEREAEDAEVRAYRDHKLKLDPSYGTTVWDNLNDDQRHVWRKDYRASREFFKEQS